ncbi:MAG: hypothetical protein MJ175_04845 [Clostridia bacterium]|nr:hypothetical protein [Clostridia bacterium]
MKKLFSVILAGVVLSALATSVSASTDGECKAIVPKVNPANPAIVVDGQMDAAYADFGAPVMIDLFNVGTETGTYGEAYMMWDDNGYYLFVKVYDADVQIPSEDLQMSSPWNTDSVEMFFDFGNDHHELTQQFRVDFSGFPSYYTEGGADSAYGAEAAAPYFDDYAAYFHNEGYNIEMRVNLTKFNVDLKEGSEIGLQLQINDMTAANESGTTAVYNMANSNDAKSWDTDLYDYVRLGAMVETIVVEEPVAEEPAADAEAPADIAPAPVAPATADAGIVAAAAVMAIAAGVVLSKKH